jgi:hypothetical protein
MENAEPDVAAESGTNVILEIVVDDLPDAADSAPEVLMGESLASEELEDADDAPAELADTPAIPDVADIVGSEPVQ